VPCKIVCKKSIGKKCTPVQIAMLMPGCGSLLGSKLPVKTSVAYIIRSTINLVEKSGA
jgi:hypothetical protein